MDVHIQKVKDLVVLSSMEVRPCRNHVWSIENPVMVSIIQVKEHSSRVSGLQLACVPTRQTRQFFEWIHSSLESSLTQPKELYAREETDP